MEGILSLQAGKVSYMCITSDTPCPERVQKTAARIEIQPAVSEEMTHQE